MLDTSEVINYLSSGKSGLKDFVDFYLDYPEKLDEVKRLSSDKLRIKELIINEVQSPDPITVVKQKAYVAWEKNANYPIAVEDTSLFISALDNFPGPFVSVFPKTIDQRRTICRIASDKKDYRVRAQTLIAIYNGRDFLIWKGECSGFIPEEPRGSSGWDWDDIFIPREEMSGKKRTFAEMKPQDKDRYSMRGKAWEKFLENKIRIEHPIFKLPEPFPQEIQRIRMNEISEKAKIFAFKLENIENLKVKPENFTVNNYVPLQKEENLYYKRYSFNLRSPSLGIVLTNIDLDRIAKAANNEPVFWQMGPGRRSLALAQRAHFFDKNQNKYVHEIIHKFETGKIKIPSRSNKRIMSVEKALGLNKKGEIIHTPAITELGYKKASTDKTISRRKITEFGLFNKIGKYPRKILGLGSMPPTTGWRDTLVTAALGHMISFIPRNSIFAGNLNMRLQLALEAKNVIDSLPINKSWKIRALNNIGASIGLDSPKDELKVVRTLYKKGGIKLFRIYTIGSDSRVIELSKLLRKEFGDEIEIFVGQIADKKQAETLISPDIKADALIFGHGGGQQCTSAINGMAITTLEDIYKIILDPKFNQTSLIVEGGIDRSIGTALLLGVDCCLGNQKMVRGTIEIGGIFVQSEKGKIGHPYPGSASPVTQIIESENADIRSRRTDSSGRTYSTEGKPGFMNFEKKANSMTFWINEHLAYAARCLADLGVENIREMRELLAVNPHQYLRIMTEKTQYLSDAYGNFAG